MRYFISVILLVTSSSAFIVLTDHKVPMLSDEAETIDINQSVAQAQVDSHSG